MTRFIAHSRTKGSKNGHRRYQNKDGTWTNEGKERRREEYASTRRANMGDIDQIAKNADKIPSNAKSIVEGTRRIKGKKNGPDLSKYSDEELRKKVNRLNLEQQYSRLTADNKSRGQEKVDGILQVAGGVTGIAASGATIGYIIWKIKHPEGN